MINIVIGTTPKITYNFQYVAPNSIDVAVFTIKKGGQIILKKYLSSATIDGNTISWRLSQDETLSIGTGIAEILLNWVNSQGVRGVSKKETVTFVRNHINSNLSSDDVIIDIPNIEPLTVNENGVYRPPSGIYGFNPVNVEIPVPQIQSKTVEPLTIQQIVEPDDGYDYLSSVIVNGFVPPFNVLPYLSSIGNMFKEKTLDIDTLVLDFEGGTIGNMYQTFYRMSGVRKLVIKNINYPEGSGASCQEIFRYSTLKVVEFVNGVFRPANNLYPMMDTQIEEFIGDIDMTYRSDSLYLSAPIRELRFVPSTIHANFSISNCVNLSVDSLVSIANGLNAETPSTLDIRRTYLLPTIQSTLGNIEEGLFVKNENGTLTLENFITNIKGWTIRAT